MAAAPSNVGAGTLNRDVFEDVIKLYKLCNESVISLHRVHGHNECCNRFYRSASFPGSSPQCSHSFFFILGSSFQLI